MLPRGPIMCPVLSPSPTVCTLPPMKVYPAFSLQSGHLCPKLRVGQRVTPSGPLQTDLGHCTELALDRSVSPAVRFVGSHTQGRCCEGYRLPSLGEASRQVDGHMPILPSSSVPSSGEVGVGPTHHHASCPDLSDSVLVSASHQGICPPPPKCGNPCAWVLTPPPPPHTGVS